MKLRNKKTGDIAVGYVMVGIQNNEKYPNPIEYHTYGSIAELNDEWDDYKPVKPLIKDALTRSGAIADDCWTFVRKITVEAGGVSRTPGADIQITIEDNRR